jgi:hypothetical protein
MEKSTVKLGLTRTTIENINAAVLHISNETLSEGKESLYIFLRGDVYSCSFAFVFDFVCLFLLRLTNQIYSSERQRRGFSVDGTL